NAIARYRELMWKTNPEEASCGTLRAEYAMSMRYNSVHGSYCPASAARDIELFFQESDICPRP
ncbi:nucleoside-diphosphate kinase, partial [Vibrio cholerae O1]|uniref:nucleoside-diphosphate kinase n=1 Tax=Vibrio cholerae TaxID=666 RepID=UPI0023DEF46C